SLSAKTEIFCVCAQVTGQKAGQLFDALNSSGQRRLASAIRRSQAGLSVSISSLIKRALLLSARFMRSRFASHTRRSSVICSAADIEAQVDEADRAGKRMGHLEDPHWFRQAKRALRFKRLASAAY